MKKSPLLLLIHIFFFCQQAFSQNPSTELPVSSNAILDSIIQIAKNNAYHSGQVDWPSLSQEMFAISTEQDSINKIGKPVEHMFETLGDYHGMLIYDYKAGFSYRPEGVGIPKDSIYKEIGRTKINLPYTVVGKLIQNNIAYIEILGTGVMQPPQIEAARETLRSVICDLKAQQPDGWILDLRCHIGGNMHPMMAGIGELIPNADLGGDTKDGVSYNTTWSLENGNFQENGYANYSAALQCPNDINEKRIAVLTSRYTASAGEVVVSSLKAQKEVKIIGEQTGGLSSSNGWFVLPEKWILAPMVGYYMSIDKTVHKNGVIPDFEIIEPLDLNDLTSGKQIDRAIKWIKSGK
ncbi:MAG: hypothetical protein Sapg2KO_48610 [Saprospiraceae bacterium]